ncbi:MAG: hypothetical protein OES09_05510, partial [Gammaproteobacteria bacterium]|nr:hypothetical protein [Gammaproteobacteria bacterium]
MEFIITKEHLAKADSAGACADRRSLYGAGMSIHDVSFDDLTWMLSCTDVTPLMGGVPLWALGHSGYGDGYGSGDGSGDGSGSGYGDGNGYGDGYGDGSGYGDGDGHGYGYGHGAGDGTG